ncbi:MAG: hypothetical protein ACRD04_06035 [Terriglobales bacterium]
MKQPWFLRKTGLTDAGTAITITAEQVKPGQWLEVTFLSLDNESGESVTVAFGAQAIGGFTKFITDTAANLSSAAGAWKAGPIFLREGETLAAQVTGTSDKGAVTFVASGWLHDYSPEVVIVSQVAAPAPAASS